jgi:L-asparaginase
VRDRCLGRRRSAGIVIADTGYGTGNGNGSVHQALQRAAQRAIAAGVPVVCASRCLLGGAFGAPADALPSYGALSPWKARIELMLDLIAARPG